MTLMEVMMWSWRKYFRSVFHVKHREEKFEGEVGKVFTLCSEGDEVSE